MFNLIVTLLLVSHPSKATFDPDAILPILAVENCKNTRTLSIDRRLSALKVASVVYEVERTLGVPDEMRGMTLAAACIESGFNPSAKGDAAYSKDKKTPKAIGVFQLWPFYERVYDIDRTSPKESAIGWLTHIKKMVKKVKIQ